MFLAEKIEVKSQICNKYEIIFSLYFLFFKFLFIYF